MNLKKWVSRLSGNGRIKHIEDLHIHSPNLQGIQPRYSPARRQRVIVYYPQLILGMKSLGGGGSQGVIILPKQPPWVLFLTHEIMNKEIGQGE
jgi:hypothetical protein